MSLRRVGDGGQLNTQQCVMNNMRRNKLSVRRAQAASSTLEWREGYGVRAEESLSWREVHEGVGGAHTHGHSFPS